MKLLTRPLDLSEKLMIIWAAVKSFIVDCCRYYRREEILVKTKTGLVKGFKIASDYEYRYFNFIGIPYAKPPIGDLRFKDPQPFEPSNGIINSEFGRRGSMPSQADVLIHEPIGTENCLHLSVFTKDIKPDTLKPVLAWIHGGAFLVGSMAKEMFNPEFLLRKDVVLISINYRLGAFGFLSLKNPELNVPGNAGLKDQVMALKWIKENCMHFGGDPDNITAFGESAGAASVSMHMLSDQSKDLFHKAILMSGTAYAPWAVSSDEEWAEKLAKKLGWDGKGGESACLAVLQKASPRSIVKMQEKITTLEDYKQMKLIPFSPVIEPYESEQCFLKKYSKDLGDSAWSKNVPVLTGICANEGFVFYKLMKKHPQIIQEDNLKSALALQELNVDTDSEECRELTKKLKEFYFGCIKESVTPKLTYFLILHDKAFVFPMHRMITSRNKNRHAPTYLLRFDFESPYSLSKRLFVGEKIPGVCHADDCSYYFRMMSGDLAKDSDEWKTMDRMCEILTTFARFGNPNNELIAAIDWQPVTFGSADHKEYSYKCLNISNELSYIDLPDFERMPFWDEIYEQCLRNSCSIRN